MLPGPTTTRVIDPDWENAPVRLLFIGGLGRSGSTLIDRCVGQLPGCWSMGEVVHIWRRGVIDNERCGCWRPFHSCPFWRDVAELAFGGWEQINGIEMMRLQRLVDRFRYVPAMVNPWLRPATRPEFERYRATLVRLYRAVQAVSGASVLVDSTKHASCAFLIRGIPDVDLRVVHLVRNSLGVAHSVTKQVVKPEVVGREAYMPTAHPGRVGLRYVLYNLAFDALQRMHVPTLLLKYESFVARPRDTLRHIAQFGGVELTADSLSFVRDDAVELAEQHTIAGNPMRFSTGATRLRVDDAWRTDMAPRHRAVVRGITLPLLMRYGYVSPASRRGARDG